MMSKQLPIMCGWHEKYFGHPLHMDGPLPTGEPGERISHGMCPACAERWKEEIAQARRVMKGGQ